MMIGKTSMSLTNEAKQFNYKEGRGRAAEEHEKRRPESEKEEMPA